MKQKNIKQSKYKNTGVLFELLVRQITAETIENVPGTPSVDIMKKYFNTKTEMGKELQLYRAIYDSTKPLSENRALNYIDIVIDQRKKLDEAKLSREKYNLIKEIKDNYPLDKFLSSKIDNYTLHASIYKTFLSETAKDENLKVINIKEVATARFTLVEHLMNHPTKRTSQDNSTILEDFRKESEDLRLLAYKLAIDKFNDKYANLNDKQKHLLREYINSVSNTTTLSEYVAKEVPVLKRDLLSAARASKDKVLAIKLNEIAHQLDGIGQKNNLQDNEMTALMIAYEILKEAS